MKVSLFYLPSLGSKADIEAGMAGMRPDLYQQMLREISEQCRLADDLGYDSVAFTEHHFHIEGFEVSNNPVLLDLYIAMQTKRLRVGQLGIVLPASNPIRVAEDIAMLDHMSGGRANAGFARGYQRRWVDIMAQHAHGVHGALPHQHDEIDAANRAYVDRVWGLSFRAPEGLGLEVPAGQRALRARLVDVEGKTPAGEDVEIEVDAMDAPPDWDSLFEQLSLDASKAVPGEVDGRPSRRLVQTREGRQRVRVAVIAAQVAER